MVSLCKNIDEGIRTLTYKKSAPKTDASTNFATSIDNVRFELTAFLIAHIFKMHTLNLSVNYRIVKRHSPRQPVPNIELEKTFKTKFLFVLILLFLRSVFL